jgi:type I restriction enzyme S subunit
MEKYQSYKPSGVEWIGEIPEHWSFIKTNILTDNLDGKRVPLNSEERGEMEGEYPYWGSNGIVDYVNQFIFNEEIVLVGEDGSPFFDKLKDVSFYVNEPVWVNNHIHILKPKERILPKFLTHSFNCVDYKEYITGSTRDKLTQSDLKRISHCVPPLQEQLQIVQFLDEKTELIDKLISTKERKITLLKEQRTSLINQVVTKGLNPNVKMKESGVEWIGEIPENWIISKLKWITLEHRQGYYSSNDYDDSGYRMVRITDINDDNTITVENSPFYEIDETDYLRFGLTNGDFLFPRTGGVGRFGIFDSHIQSIYGSFLIRFRFTNEIIHSFIKFYLNSSIFLTEIEKEIHGGVNKNVHVENIKDCIIVYPKSTSEQLQIVKHLDIKTKEIDDLVELEQNKIDLLKEYRQSLISEVVTGKRKVVN